MLVGSFIQASLHRQVTFLLALFCSFAILLLPNASLVEISLHGFELRVIFRHNRISVLFFLA